MGNPLNLLIRVIALLSTLACGSAIFVARLTTPPARFLLHRASHKVPVNQVFLRSEDLGCKVLDTETGTFEPLTIPPGDRLDWASVSDWVDEHGRSQIAGRWSRHASDGVGDQYSGFGIARYSFPDGKALNRVRLNLILTSAPCWFPNSPNRVLLTAADGRLYTYRFPDDATGGDPSSAQDTQLKPIRCAVAMSALADATLDDVEWCREPRWGDVILASVRHFRQVGNRRVPTEQRIWWLKLNPEGTMIVAAGQVSREEPNHESVADATRIERFPKLIRMPDGGPGLLYHECREDSLRGTLRVVHLEVDPVTGEPSCRPSTGRNIAENCMAAPVAVSSDGSWVYAVQKVNSQVALQRFSLFDSRLTPPSSLAQRRLLAPDPDRISSTPDMRRPG